jgi:hypothetical protein
VSATPRRFAVEANPLYLCSHCLDRRAYLECGMEPRKTPGYNPQRTCHLPNGRERTRKSVGRDETC